MMSCKLKPKHSSYWYDLSLAFYYQAKYESKLDNDILTKFQKCILHAINLNPNNHHYWNLLGIFYILKSNSKSKLID